MDKKNYSAPALDKGLDILELLAVSASGLTQAEIAEHLNKSVNEIYRMLNTLKVRNYLEFDSSTDSYKLSYKLLNLSASFNPTKTLLQKAHKLFSNNSRLRSLFFKESPPRKHKGHWFSKNFNSISFCDIR